MNHVTLEVPRQRMADEVAWWKIVMSFSEEEPYSDKYGARWVYRWFEIDTTTAGGAVELPTGGPVAVKVRWQLHLFPVPHATHDSVGDLVEAIIPRYGHLAFTLGHEGLALAVRSQQHFGGRVERGTPYWGTPRYMLDTPGGHRVEVMATGPRPEGSR